MADKQQDLWLNLGVGALVYHGERACRIKTTSSLDTVLLEDLQTRECFTAKINDLLPDPGDGATTQARGHVNFLEIAQEDWDRAKERQEVLDELLQKGIYKSQDIVDCAQQLGLTSRHIYNLVRRYQESGLQLAALLPTKPSGGAGKLRLAANIEDIITAVIKEIYLNRQRFSASYVVLEVKKRCQAMQLEPPSEYAIRARIKCWPLKEALTERYGSKISRAETTPIVGHFPEAAHPLAVLQMDHTLVDVMVVDEYLRQSIGRPYLTLAIDVYSRCITGFCLTLEAPSALSVGLCLTHSVFDKEEWLSLRKVKTSWPIWGKPGAIYVDNAAEFHSEAMQRGCDFHGIKLEFRPPGMPHYGGIIERVIGTFMQLIHQIPGTTFSNIAEKGDYDSEARAALTLAELEKWLTIAICDYYHQKCHQGIHMAPLGKYKAGTLGDKDVIGIGYPARVSNKRAFLIDFLPIERRQLQRSGFVLDRITYYGNALAPWVARRRDLGKFVIRRDPRDLSRIFVLDPELEQYLEIPCRTLSRPMITLWEHKEAIKMLRKQGQEINETLIFRAVDDMRTITKEAVVKSRAARRKHQRLQDINKEPAQIKGDGVTSYSSEKSWREVLPFEDIEIW